MIYIPSFIKTGSGHSEVNREGFTYTQSAWRSRKPTLGK
jgi:hypothetical protein